MLLLFVFVVPEHELAEFSVTCCCCFGGHTVGVMSPASVPRVATFQQPQQQHLSAAGQQQQQQQPQQLQFSQQQPQQQQGTTGGGGVSVLPGVPLQGPGMTPLHPQHHPPPAPPPGMNPNPGQGRLCTLSSLLTLLLAADAANTRQNIPAVRRVNGFFFLCTAFLLRFHSLFTTSTIDWQSEPCTTRLIKGSFLPMVAFDFFRTSKRVFDAEHRNNIQQPLKLEQ